MQTYKVPVARDIMSTHIVSLFPDYPIEEVIELMQDNEIPACPVVDEDDILVGLRTQNNCIQYLASNRWHGAETGPVANFMDREIPAVHPDVDIFALSERFQTLVGRVLPVVEERTDKILGVVTRRDILRATMRPWDKAEQAPPDPRYLTPAVKAKLDLWEKASTRGKGFHVEEKPRVHIDTSLR